MRTCRVCWALHYSSEPLFQIWCCICWLFLDYMATVCCSEFTVVPFEDLSPTIVPSHLLGLMSFSNKKPWSEWRQCCMAWPPTRGHCGALKSSLTHLLSDRLCVNWDFKTNWVDISWWSWKEKVLLEELLKVQKLSEDFVWFLVCWWHVIHFFWWLLFSFAIPRNTGK